MDENIPSGIPAIIAAARCNVAAEVVDALIQGSPTIDMVPAIPLLVLRNADGSAEHASVLEEVKAWRDEFATKPIRRQGSASLSELDSFVAHAVRFKDAGSAIFVDGGATSPRFTSVLDYHLAGEAAKVDPRFGRHRGIYRPDFSPEWKVWREIDRKVMSQEIFATLVSTNIRDVLDVATLPDGRLSEAATWYAARFGGKRAPGAFYADAQRLLDLSEGLSVTVTDAVSDVARRDTGEVRISFTSQATTDLEIPVAFLLEIPVFVGGDPWQIPVRLRFNVRTEGDTKRASWRVELFGADRTVLAVVAEMRERIGTGTSLPIFAGCPEG